MKANVKMELMAIRTFKDKNGKEKHFCEMYADGDLLKFFISEEKAIKLADYIRQERTYPIYIFNRDGKLSILLGDIE